MKAQSAMEYLMTYGWAILIIAVVLGALFQMGVFSGANIAPRASPGSCRVFRPNGPETTGFITLQGTCTNLLPKYVARVGSGSISISPAPTILEPGALTISVWFYEPSFPGCYPEVGAGVPFSQGYLLLPPCSSDGGMTIGNGAESYTSFSASKAPAGSWYNEVGTFNGTNSVIYLNGVRLSSGTSNGITYTGVTHFLIASGAGTYLSNLQVYNASLSTAEVEALYKEGIGAAPIKLQNLLGWWPLNGDANDYSGNNNNGAQSGTIQFLSTWSQYYSLQ